MGVRFYNSKEITDGSCAVDPLFLNGRGGNVESWSAFML